MVKLVLAEVVEPKLPPVEVQLLKVKPEFAVAVTGMDRARGIVAARGRRDRTIGRRRSLRGQLVLRVERGGVSGGGGRHGDAVRDRAAVGPTAKDILHARCA
jgi:hypothetical protein